MEILVDNSNNNLKLDSQEINNNKPSPNNIFLRKNRTSQKLLPRMQRLTSFESILTKDTIISNLSEDLNYNKIINNNIDNIKLTHKNKKLLILRVIILILALIYIPFDSISDNKNIKYETNYIFKQDKFEFFISSNIVSFYIFNILDIFTNVESVLIYSIVFYLLFHPFKIIKNLFFLSIIIYLTVIMRLIYSASRPFWYFTKINILCPVSYSKPSITLISFCLFIGLNILMYFENIKKEKQNISVRYRIFGLLIFFICCTIMSLLNISSYEDFIYQQIISIVYTLIFIVIYLEFETGLHNFFLENLKSIENIRSFKIYNFIFILFIFIFSLIIYSISSSSNISKFSENLSYISNCKDIFMFGNKATFMDTSIIFIQPGIFFGSGYTIEKNLPKWWNKKKKIKEYVIIITVLIFGFLYFQFFKFIESISNCFELNYILRCFKYFLFFFISFGLIPHIIIRIDNYSTNEFDNRLSFDEEDKGTYLFSNSSKDKLYDDLNKKSYFEDSIFENSSQLNSSTNSQQGIKGSFKKKVRLNNRLRKKKREKERSMIVSSINKINEMGLFYQQGIEEVSEKSEDEFETKKNNLNYNKTFTMGDKNAQIKILEDNDDEYKIVRKNINTFLKERKNQIN